ncbi:MAG: hypothetical protein WCS27_08635, partial [Victivallaceae bacterium]
FEPSKGSTNAFGRWITEPLHPAFFIKDLTVPLLSVKIIRINEKYKPTYRKYIHPDRQAICFNFNRYHFVKALKKGIT